MKSAIITETMIAPGGGDRFLDTICALFPEADIFCPVFDRQEYQKAGWHFAWFDRVDEFMSKGEAFHFRKPNRLRSLKKRFYNTFAPYFYENLDLREYNFVISLSARFAKSVITSPDTCHINIFLTPARYEWDNDSSLRTMQRYFFSKIVSSILAEKFRKWDYFASYRPDYHISISNYVAAKVKRFYGIDSEVIYPPIEDFWFESNNHFLRGEDDFINLGIPDKYFLCVSRLYDYKRIDWAIEAALKNHENLMIVGEGPDKKYLKSLAKNNANVKFLGFVGDNLLRKLYKNAEALIFPGEEDFGFVPVEAMAGGCPVIAYNQGGVAETVIDGQTGLLFEDLDDLIKHLRQIDSSRFDMEIIKSRAREFNRQNFAQEMERYIKSVIKV